MLLSRLAATAAIIWLGLVGASLAQTPPGAPAAGLPAAAASAAQTPADPAAQRAQLEALAKTLEDDKARARLIEQLRALSAASPPPAQGGLSAALDQLQTEAGERVEMAAVALIDLGASVAAVPELITWIGSQLSDEVSRVILWTVLSETGLAVALGIAASILIRLALRGWRRRRTQLSPSPTTGEKLGFAGARLFVDLVALVVFIAATYAALRLLDVTFLARAVALDVLTGIALGRMITAASRTLLTTEAPRARLPRLSNRQALAVRRWVSLVTGLAIYGYVILAAARRLGLPWTVHAFLQHVLFLIVTLLVLVGIIRIRRHLAALSRSLGEARDAWLRRLVPWEALAVAAPYVLAAWVTLLYLVWALGIPAGATLLTRGAVATILALALLRLVAVGTDRLLMRPQRTSADTGEADEERERTPASTGRTLAVTAVRVAAGIVAALVVLQAWGVGVSGWLASSTGRGLIGRVVGVVAVTGVAGLVYFAIDRFARRYIAAEDSDGNPIHDNRTRTLANILRNLALTATLFIVVGHILSQLGVNTTAILAGAGVVGFAIGFGSQKLVQDLTTGLFILLGDTVRVGDVVRLGDRSGVVEGVSMRTVTLRDYNGDVHTIPYSSISIVTNMTKDYGFAVFRVTVGYREDVDRVMDVLLEIDSQLRREWPYRRIMLEPLDIAGVDAFTERGVDIVARSRTRAGEQWKVLREFNRRLKKRFDELGIEFPIPQQTVHVSAGEAQEPARRPLPRPEIVRAELRGGEG